MKLRHLFVILMVILLVGCAKPEVTPEPAPVQAPEPAAPVVAPEPVPEPIPVVETAPKPVEEPKELTETETELLGAADVALKKDGFNPATVTVKKGGSIMIKVLDDNRHALTPKFVADYRSKALVKGEDTEINFPDVGEYKFVDVTYGKWLTVTVTE